MAKDGRDMLLRLPSGLSSPEASSRRYIQSRLSPSATLQSSGGPERDFQAYPSPPMSDSSPPLRRSVNRVEDESLPAPLQPRSVPSIAEHSRIQPTILPAPVLVSGALSQSSASTETAPVTTRDHYGVGLLPGLRPAPSYRNIFASSLQTEPLATVSSVGAAEHAALPVQLTPLSGQSQWRTVRPARRAKAHVASACVNCKRAHLSCDVQRPCSRCVAGGKEDTCFDVQHKKRGRPRLREDRAPRLRGSDEPSVTFPQTIPAIAGPSSQISGEPYQAPWQQTLPSTTNEPEGVRQSRKRRASNIHTPFGRATQHFASVGEAKPFCLLDLNFNIIKSNDPFSARLRVRGSIRGRSIIEFMDTKSRDSMLSMKAQLHNEKSQCDPAYLPPILSLSDHEALQSISQTDLPSITRGFTERNIRITFTAIDGQTTTSTCQIQLAKTTVFFVVLVICQSMSRDMPVAMSEYSEALSQAQMFGSMASISPGESQRLGRQLSIPSPSSAPQHVYQSGSSMFAPVKTQAPNVHSLASFSRSATGYYQQTRQPMGLGGMMTSTSDPSALSASGAETASQTATDDGPRADSLQNLHLPPILGSNLSVSPVPSALQSPEMQSQGQQSRLREAVGEEGGEESPERERGKKRRLDIHEVLE